MNDRNTAGGSSISDNSIWPDGLTSGHYLPAQPTTFGQQPWIAENPPKGAAYIGIGDDGLHYCCVASAPKMRIERASANISEGTGSLECNAEKGSSYGFSHKFGLSVTGEATFDFVVASSKVSTTIFGEIGFKQSFSKSITVGGTIPTEPNKFTVVYTGSFQVEYYRLYPVWMGTKCVPLAFWNHAGRDHIETGCYAVRTFPLSEMPKDMIP